MTLRDELRRRGIPIGLKELKPAGQSKDDRIRAIVWPYQEGIVHWPSQGIKKVTSSGKGYDLMAEYKKEYCAWPRSAHDDLLDCHAYFEHDFSIGAEFKTLPVPEEKPPKERTGVVSTAGEQKINKKKVVSIYGRPGVISTGAQGRRNYGRRIFGTR